MAMFDFGDLNCFFLILLKEQYREMLTDSDFSVRFGSQGMYYLTAIYYMFVQFCELKNIQACK